MGPDATKKRKSTRQGNPDRDRKRGKKAKPKAPPETTPTPSTEASVLKANMHVDIAIEIKILNNVWTVPLEALKTKENKDYLRLRKNGVIQEQEVEVLARSENLAALKGDFTGQEELVIES